MPFFSSDTIEEPVDASIRVYKYCPERTGFNMYAENTQPQLTFLAVLPWQKPERTVYIEDQPVNLRRNGVWRGSTCKPLKERCIERIDL